MVLSSGLFGKGAMSFSCGLFGFRCGIVFFVRKLAVGLCSGNWQWVCPVVCSGIGSVFVQWLARELAQRFVREVVMAFVQRFVQE